MNKEHFNKLVNDYSKVDEQFIPLEKLVKEYPYSQPVRMLDLKSSTSKSAKDFQQRLWLAAFYATDRNVLRNFIEEGKLPTDTKRKVISSTQSKKPVAKKIPAEKTQHVSHKTIDADQLRKEVIANLTLLQQTKSSFLKLAELEDAQPIKKPVKKLRSKKKPIEKRKLDGEQTIEKKPAARNATSIDNTVNPPKKNTKKELIDKFIANKPSITRNKMPSKNQSDLSKTSSQLKEDLVSENLAVIFAKQGKTDKAIEIYKKLIWKFPQKKASFAAQIEELKKKKG